MLILKAWTHSTTDLTQRGIMKISAASGFTVHDICFNPLRVLHNSWFTTAGRPPRGDDGSYICYSRWFMKIKPLIENILNKNINLVKHDTHDTTCLSCLVYSNCTHGWLHSLNNNYLFLLKRACSPEDGVWSFFLVNNMRSLKKIKIF